MFSIGRTQAARFPWWPANSRGTLGRVRATGALTFVFTDIEGSTVLWERAPEEMAQALERHDVLLRDAIGGSAGTVFATGGDGVAAVFERAHDAITAACDLQRQLASEPWPAATPIRVRVGVHSGHAEERDGDYFGSTLNRTARLMAIAHGGQVVCSGATAALLEGSEPAPFIDLGQHRLRDLSAPLAVFQVGEGSFPPLRSLDSVPSNLPTSLTDLVGRTDDISALAGEVRHHRVVTLTGVGGIGKTRLALAVGGTVAPDFIDGCWLVELAPVADGSEVLRSIVASLGASTVAVADGEALRRYLEHRRLVLILDNCEHVLDAAADAVDLILDAAPDVHIVTTSREPLGVDGEVVRRIRSLSLPDRADPMADLGGSAVRLFVERARAADGDFDLTEANIDDVVDICQHLDGIPLAIELAAARVAAMTPAEIARRLDDRFRVLTGGRRAQERHRTLQAAVGWSYDLLSLDDRTVFTQLSVFPASFGLTAATAVAAGDDIDEHGVVDAVLRLVQRSLVVHDHTTGRYRLLETLRQYSADRLAETTESEATRERYARHYLGVATIHGPGMTDHRHDGSVETLIGELDHLRATAEWCIREERWTELHRLSVDGVHFWAQFLPGEATEWLEHVLGSDDITNVRDRVDVLGYLALVAGNALRFETALERGGEAIALAAEHGIPDSPWACHATAMPAIYGVAPADSALENIEAMLRAADTRDDEFAAVVATALSVSLLARLGRHDEATQRAEESLRRATELANASALSVSVLNTFAALVFDTDAPDLEQAAALMDGYAGAASTTRGGSTFAWLVSFRALVSVETRPRQATAWAVEATLAADRAGIPFAVVGGLEILTLACLRAGLTAEAFALCDHLDALPAEVYIPTTVTLRDQRRTAVEAAVPSSSLAAPTNRTELLTLLRRIEHAVA
jgi:predicted ATPase/class 3 adenylate cyclase